MKKKLVFLGIILFLFSSLICVPFVRADSGFDSGGSSGGGGGSYSSSSSSSSGGGDGGSGLAAGIAVFGSILLIVLSIYIIKLIEYLFYLQRYRNVSKDKLLECNITDIDNLKNNLFDLFVKEEQSFLDRDLVKLKDVCTFELYDMYRAEFQFVTKKLRRKIFNKDKRNVKPTRSAQGYSIDEFRIYDVRKSGNRVYLEAFLRVAVTYDNGKKEKDYIMYYLVKFVRLEDNTWAIGKINNLNKN